MKNKIFKLILPALAVIGILLSLELIFVYFKANFLAGAVPSFCDINEVISCDAVAKTSFSRFLGVPLSVYGLIYYFIILFLGLAVINKEKGLFRRFVNPQSYIFSLSTVSILVSFVLAWISSAIIHKICLLCYITYFLNLFILIASKPGLSILEHYKNTVKDFLELISNPTNKALLIIGIIFTAVALLYVNKFNIFVPKNLILAENLNSQSYINEGNYFGAKNPKVIINEYTDFQCPYCGISNSMLHRLVSEVDGVAVIHHDFPLDSVCNPLVKHSAHKNSCMLSQYSKAAKLQGKFWDLTNMFFDNQENISETKVLEFAKNLNLDIEKLKKDAKSPETLSSLKDDISQAEKLGITSTPTYVIGIKVYQGLMPYPELKQKVIEAGGIPK